MAADHDAQSERYRKPTARCVLGRALCAEVGEVLQPKVGTGSIVHATIIGAPSSTKNANKARDPEMHQTKKFQQRYSGMKMQERHALVRRAGSGKPRAEQCAQIPA